MKQKSSLDIGKFICAILILIIHTNPFGSYSKALSFGFRNIVCVIAVPYFFCVSGYLLSEKLNSLTDTGDKKGYILKYLKRLLVIYLVWSAVYFPFVVIKWLNKGFTFGLIMEYIKDFIFEGSFSTIWFLPALMSAAAIYYILRKKLSSKTVFLIGCGIYVITLLLSSYYGITAKLPVLSQLGEAYYSFFGSVKNGVLFGFVFVSMGGMLQEQQVQMTRTKAFLGTLVSFGLLVAEVVVYKKIGNTRGIDTVASLIPLTIFAILFTLSFDVKPSKVCLSLRKYSMLIFLCQRIPITVIELFLANTVLATNTMVNFVTVSAATVLISFLILQLSKPLPWLKKIY